MNHFLIVCSLKPTNLSDPRNRKERIKEESLCKNFKLIFTVRLLTPIMEEHYDIIYSLFNVFNIKNGFLNRDEKTIETKETLDSLKTDYNLPEYFMRVLEHNPNILFNNGLYFPEIEEIYKDILANKRTAGFNQKSFAILLMKSDKEVKVPEQIYKHEKAFINNGCELDPFLINEEKEKFQILKYYFTIFLNFGTISSRYFAFDKQYQERNDLNPNERVI